MATNINTILNWFKTDLKPTQAQFWDSWTSFWHKDEIIPQSSISNLTTVLNAKVEKSQFDAHQTDENAHIAMFALKENKSEKGYPNGYVPLNAYGKILTDYLNVVNDLVTGGTESLLTAEQGKILQTQINAINTLLTSNDINLDTIQEIVDAIKSVQTWMNTILVNDLTSGGVTKALTAEMGKTLKGLVDTLTATVNSKMSTMVTTLKTITSANLSTQDASGFVSYINALSVPLVVANNETVEYQLSDTGKIFKLLLRGRSFGAGQPAITVANVEDEMLWMQKDLKLSNYPATRNDGQTPTNRMLSCDANGNLKMYTQAVLPAPYMEVLIPDSTLPSTTTNFTIKGAFFTPNMTVSIVGQTINYVTFFSDNLIKVNVTTGATEGYFNVTLDNGISRTFNGALLIVLGTVYKPTQSEWIIQSGVPDLSIEGEVHLTTYNSAAQAVWSKEFDYTRNFSVRFKLKPSPFGNPGGNTATHGLELIGATDGLWKYYLGIDPGNGYTGVGSSNGDGGVVPEGSYWLSPTVLEFRNYNGIFFLYSNNGLRKTYATPLSQNLKFRVLLRTWDVVDIKYIELP